MRLLCTILGLLAATQLLLGHVQHLDFRLVRMEDLQELSRINAGWPATALTPRSDAQVMSLTEYREFLKKKGFSSKPVYDLTIPTAGLARMVEADLVSLARFDQWIKSGSSRPNPLPRWCLLEGQVEELLAEGAILKLVQVNKKPITFKVFLRVSLHSLPLTRDVKLGCYARQTGSFVEIRRDTSVHLPVYDYGEAVPDPLMQGYAVKMPIRLPLAGILQLAAPPDPDKALIEPALIPEATGLKRVLADKQTVDLQPLHEWVELRGIGPKPVPDWHRVQGVIKKATPAGFWLEQTLEDFRTQLAHAILRCPPDVPGIVAGGRVNLYLRKTGEFAPLPGFADLVPVYEYDGRAYVPDEPEPTPTRRIMTDPRKIMEAITARPPVPDTKAEKIAALTQQLEELNREYVQLTNRLYHTERAAGSVTMGPSGYSVGRPPSREDNIRSNLNIQQARQAVTANRQKYAHVEAEIHRIKADTAENRAAQADKLLEWQQQRAEQGSASAQYDLALRYLEGKGVTQDEAEALRLLRAAAAQGHTQASDKLKALEKVSPAQP